MQIACPNCKTLYQIASAAIGASGRSVRCARCQHVWYVPTSGQVMEPTKPALSPAAAKADSEDVGAFSAELGKPALEPKLPPAAEPSPATSATPAGPSLDEIAALNASPTSPETAAIAAAPGEPAAASLSDITIAVEDAPPLAPDHPGGDALPATPRARKVATNVESVAAKRAAMKRGRRIPTAAVIAVLGVAVAALLGLRKDVVQHVPQLASFYSAIHLPVNLRGVAFTDLKIGNEIHDGVPVLVIEGAIVSITSKPVDMPRLRFALRNASGAEIYSWTVQPPQPVLEPFDSVPFRSRLAAPPAEGHDVQVRFFTRRDALASR